MDKTLKIWDWSTNTVLLNLAWWPSDWKGYFKFLSNGLLVAPYNKSTSYAYNWATGETKYSLNGSFVALEQLSNGNLIGLTADKYIRIWNPQTGQLIYQLYTGVTYFSLRQTSIPNWVAGGCSDFNVYVMDINTLSVVRVLSGNSNAFLYLETTSSGLLLGASGDNYNGLKLWNVPTSEELSSLVFGTAGGPTSINCMKIISSNQVVVAFMTNSIKFVNITSANTLISVQTVNLITNSQVYDMRMTMEDILLLAQKDGSVFFMNINTKSFVQALLPVASTSAVIYNIDLISL
jgi:WD40 repeat protein